MSVRIEALSARNIIAIAKKAVNHDGVDLTPMIENAVTKEKMPGYSVFIDGVLVGVCGVVPFWWHRGEAWAMITPYATEKCGLTVCRVAREIIQRFHVDYEFVRLEAPIPAELHANLRWAQWLGFKPESLMGRAGIEGGDVYMMVHIQEGANAN